jgi:GT2 family glycosyltransferase
VFFLEQNMPKVTVVIINAKGTQRLEKCLKSLEQTNYPNFEVIVVDCLTPNLSTWMEKRFPRTEVIHYDIDIGPSASHNIDEQFMDPESKYLAFLDNDAYVTENWLKELLKIVEKDEKIGVAQAKIVLLRDKQRLDHSGLAIDALGTWYTTRNLRVDRFKSVFDIFAASSAACIVRRKVFYEVGGFDPDYFIYDDDTDFSFRVHLFGYRIVYVPQAVVFHEGETARSLNPRKLYHGFKNRMCTMLKNYEMGNALWRFSLYLSLALLSGIGLFLGGKAVEARAMFRSIIYPVVNIKEILVKRALVQHQRRVADKELFQKRFIMNNIRPTVIDLISKLQLLQKQTR